MNRSEKVNDAEKYDNNEVIQYQCDERAGSKQMKK
jgi:hypothetical protein